MADMKIQGEVSLDTTKAEGGFARVEQSAGKMAAGVKKAGADAAKGVDGIGNGSEAASKKVESSAKSMIGMIQRLSAQYEAGEKNSSKYFEALAKQRGINSEVLRPYLSQLDAAKAKQDAAANSLSGFDGVAGQARATMLSLGAAFAGAFSFNAIVGLGGKVLEVQRQFDILNSSLITVTGSSSKAEQEMEWIRRFAATTPYQLNEVTQAFVKMKSLGLDASEESLRSYGNTASAMGKSINQMIEAVADASTGEFERLKEFGIKARKDGEEVSLTFKGVTTTIKNNADEITEYLKRIGDVDFATAMSERAKTLDGAISNLSDSWDGLTLKISQSGIGEFAGQQVKTLSYELGILGDALDQSKERGDGFWKTMGNAAGAATGRVAFQLLNDSIHLVAEAIGPMNLGLSEAMRNFDAIPDNLKPVAEQMTLTTEKIKQAEVEYARLADRLAMAPDNIYIKSELGNLAKYIDTLRLAQAEQRRLMGLSSGDAGAIGSVGSGDASLARAQRAAYDKQKAAVDAAMKTYATPSEKLAEEIKAQKAAMGELFTPELEKRITESFIKPTKAGAAASKEAAAALKALKQEAETESKFRQTIIDKEREWAEESAKAQTAARIAAAQSNNAAFDAEFAAIEKKRLANEAQIKTGREMLEQIEFETSLIGMNTQQREQAIAMRELERSGIVKGTQAYEAYAESIKKGMMDRAAQQEMLDFWKQIDSTAESVFMDIAMNGEDAFKRIGESIKREVIQMLYEMTVKKWIFQIAGISTGGGTDWISMASKAYDSYTSGASSAAGGAAGAAGGAAAGASVAATYGTTAGSQQTAMLAAQEAGMTSGGSAMYAYMGYAALIAAAVMVAENLYSKGYTRAALGYGDATTGQIGQYSSYTSDPNISQSNMQYSPAMLMTTFDRTMMDALGVSEKWADIFSGTVRMATLVGRKLSGYGLEAEFVNGDVSVSGYADYKGGLFRSDKTVDVAVDERDANALKAQVEAMQQGTRAMAQAMGYSTEEVDNYTGSLKLNFKGVENSAEAAERLQKAMDDMQFSMLKAASGSSLSREEFDKFMEGVLASIEAAGISSAGIADILVQGMTGRLSEADVGDQLASTIVGGIYNAIAGQYAAVIAESFMASIITPIFTAITAGVPISQAISQAAIDNVVATAQNAAAVLNAIFSEAGFRDAIAGIEAAIGGVAGAATSINVPSFGTPSSVVSEVNEAEQERYNLETELLTLLGQTTVLRERELAALDESNQSLQLQIWALEDSKDAVDSAMDALTRAIESQREILQEQLTDALDVEQSLNDIFGILKDSIADLRGEVEGASAMSANAGMEAIRAAISGTEIDSETLSDAIDAVRTAIEDTTYETAFERDRAVLSFAGELSTLAGVTEKELSTAEQQVALLEEQLEALDVQLDTAQQQIDALYGVDTSVKSVEEAVTALTVAMAGYSAAVEAAALVSVSNGAAPEVSSSGGSSGGYSGSSGGSSSAAWTADGYWSKNPDLQSEYQRLLGLDPSQSDPKFNKDSSLSYRDEYLKWHWETLGKSEGRKFAKGGAFTNGIVQGPTAFNMGLMGESGPEAILPLTNVNGRLGVGAADSKKTDELLQKVLDEMELFHLNSISEAKTGNKMLKKWDGDGIPETRVVTA